MNSVTLVLAWCALQVTLVSLVAAIVYLTVCRRKPALGSAVLVAGFLGVLLTTALAASPWPRWYTLAWNETLTERPAPPPPPVAVESVAAEQPTAVALPAASAPPSFTPADSSFATALAETLRTGFTVPTADAPRTTPWAAILFAAGIAMCIGRLALGLAVVRNYRHRSAPVVDDALCREFAQLRAEMNCSRPVELRESESLSSPAVVGWRRPLLLLPLDWRTWSEGELRAVLAHELAHVCRGDYPAWLLSQLGLALHFYHPLVHWLVRRLRLEQELAADEWGAHIAGSRTIYLRALAQLALRRDARPVVWVAQPFFPRRDTFLRRIEMLRRQQHQPWQPTSWRMRAAAVSAVICVAVVVVGLRGPNAALAQLGAGAAEAPEQTSGEKFSLKFVPPEAMLVAAFRPVDLLRDPGLKALTETWEFTAHLKERGVAPADLEEITLIYPFELLPFGAGPQRRPHNIDPMAVIRSPKAAALVTFIEKTGLELETRTFEGASYRYSTRMRPPAAFVADGNTLVVGDETQIRRAIATARGTDKPASPPWAELWNSQPAGDGRLAFNVKAWSAAKNTDDDRAGRSSGESGELQAALAAFRPLEANVSALVGNLRVDGGLKLSAEAATDSSAAAAEVVESTIALRTVAKNLARENRQKMARQPETPAGVPQLLAMLEDLLVHSEIKADDKLVEITAASSYDSAKVAATLRPALVQTREASVRTEAVNNLKQLGLAMYTYADLAGDRFPPAVLYGPDGKTPYSWRVALLPHLGEQALYEQYNFNEPWDSEANRRVLENMPAVFRNPNRAEGTTTSYFVLTGPETLFAGQEGQKYAEIPDGSSNTLLIVEAKRDIPWTKPDDIPYDGKLSATDLGGFFNGGFNAALADGSVRFVSQKTDDTTLRALITARGGEKFIAPAGPAGGILGPNVPPR